MAEQINNLNYRLFNPGMSKAQLEKQLPENYRLNKHQFKNMKGMQMMTEQHGMDDLDDYNVSEEEPLTESDMHMFMPKQKNKLTMHSKTPITLSKNIPNPKKKPSKRAIQEITSPIDMLSNDLSELINKQNSTSNQNTRERSA